MLNENVRFGIMIIVRGKAYDMIVRSLSYAADNEDGSSRVHWTSGPDSAYVRIDQ